MEPDWVTDARQELLPIKLKEHPIYPISGVDWFYDEKGSSIQYSKEMMKETLTFRLATENDLLHIIRMLADDTLGATRERVEDSVSKTYEKAFQKITADSNQELTVAEMSGEIVATFHLTFIQYLTHQGGLRAQIEAVRTNARYRGQGIGKQVFDYAINRAKEKGCRMVQLTSDKQRPDAIRFYESLGFKATHEGMKLKLG